MTTPPFPYSRDMVREPTGLPIVFEGIDDDERHHLHYGEVGLKDGQLVTSGAYGWTMVVTGTGASVREARDRANHLADRVIIPNARYRRDIGDRLIAGELDRITAMGCCSQIVAMLRKTRSAARPSEVLRRDDVSFWHMQFRKI